MEKKANAKTREEVLEAVEKNDVKFIRLWFTDILGQLKSFAITPRELEGAFEEGMGFDGSSIKGFARIDESDMLAKPDPATFQILPWRPKENTVARMFCDILKPDGSSYEGDPRYILKRNLEKLKNEHGYTFYVGPELEYFYLKNSKNPEVLDEGGYFDLTTLDAGGDLRRDTILTLEAMGIEVEYSHHEVAPSQHEIDLRYRDALTMADQVMTYRIVVKEIAQHYGFYATFMPKPIFGVNGSGMHTHQSLFLGDRNAFFDPNDEHHLSEVGKRYIAGLLRHAPEITAVTNQWVNSYKRLVPGYEAPVYITWARRNRSTLVRVPMYKPGKEKATRVEFRSPDPACNPYLAFSVMLAAGMAGIKDKYELPPPTEKDVYHLSEEEKKKEGIKSLPGSLIEALALTEKSSLVKEALGEHIFWNFIISKKVEWDRYRANVTEWELKEYLSVL
ncbi:MAG: glutamine synthetase [Candidatus Methanoliparum thermophilum]|uniref:Glutamine synthetase n=1 Tax=Methanoliparum thermophilum TaxID=2491083 RepID=A0A520KS69_METT2|nr:glutamine synthetase family protein [Candidatus Methanoliparum sp. LAM-1]RZN64631.1 MAG: glutamine synthetase [Candidatus Methanoliparum thermophilum]BDC35744.1 type I glutamate--ammonia ligase [Candidatus Methanoliparum sp. LAM-1]